ncbi:MAG: YezD family protein [Dehalococcoidales bacterium]|nr:YezD family protein [Dehalococcoidales bacterium]
MSKTFTFDTLESRDKTLLLKILETIKDVSFGTVQITIHDSRIVQIDKTEKIRISHSNTPVSR